MPERRQTRSSSGSNGGEDGPQLPQSPETEDALLGAILQDWTIFALARGEGITAAHFWTAHGRAVWQSIETFAEEAGENRLDVATLAESMDRHRVFADGNALRRLLPLIDACPAKANARHYCGILRDKWVCRTVVDVARQMAQSAVGENAKGADILAEASASLMDLRCHRRQRSKPEIVAAIKDRWERAAKGEQLSIPSAWPRFDFRTGGPRRGTVTVLAGRKGRGKSTLVANWIRAIGRAGIPCGWFAFEDGDQIAWSRAAAIGGGFSLYDVERGIASEGVRGLAGQSLDEAVKLPIEVIGTRGMTVEVVRSEIARGCAALGWQAVFVDGFKDIARSSRRDALAEEARISSILCDTAEQFGPAIVVVHHVRKQYPSRDVEADPDTDITMEDVRGSSRITDDARMVLALQVQSYRLHCLANNYGPCGVLHLDFDPRTGVFLEAKTDEQEH